MPLNAIDCPDGLARCTGGVVEASRLAMIPQPCSGSPERCTCPWERVGACARGCVADGVELVVPRERANRQLCLPQADGGAFFAPPPAAEAPVPACDEGQLYRCAAGVVVACAGHAVVASCARGCAVEGGFVDDDAVAGPPKAARGYGTITREAAFAILCSR